VEASGRVVVVTGGGSGIGAALCRAFAGAGAEVVVVADVNEAAARAVAEEVGGIAAPTDVTRESDVRELVQRTVDVRGRLDIYCSNAGVAVAGGEEAPDEVWRKSWDVHVMAHVYAARALIPAMLERGEGYIVGTVSAAALLNHVRSAPYAVSKAPNAAALRAVIDGGDGQSGGKPAVASDARPRLVTHRAPEARWVTSAQPG
jgi:NAD(P)-dependent dehydrogenase (short-subunit alcohol dehydrogenase family)